MEVLRNSDSELEDGNGSDLSDREFMQVRRDFNKLLPKYGYLWKSMQPKTHPKGQPQRHSGSALSQPRDKGQHLKNRIHHGGSQPEQHNGIDCCPPQSFVPLYILEDSSNRMNRQPRQSKKGDPQSHPRRSPKDIQPFSFRPEREEESRLAADPRKRSHNPVVPQPNTTAMRPREYIILSDSSDDEEEAAHENSGDPSSTHPRSTSNDSNFVVPPVMPMTTPPLSREGSSNRLLSLYEDFWRNANQEGDTFTNIPSGMGSPMANYHRSAQERVQTPPLHSQSGEWLDAADVLVDTPEKDSPHEVSAPVPQTTTPLGGENSQVPQSPKHEESTTPMEQQCADDEGSSSESSEEMEWADWQTPGAKKRIALGDNPVNRGDEVLHPAGSTEEDHQTSNQSFANHAVATPADKEEETEGSSSESSQEMEWAEWQTLGGKQRIQVDSANDHVDNGREVVQADCQNSTHDAAIHNESIQGDDSLDDSACGEWGEWQTPVGKRWESARRRKSRSDEENSGEESDAGTVATRVAEESSSSPANQQSSPQELTISPQRDIVFNETSKGTREDSVEYSGSDEEAEFEGGDEIVNGEIETGLPRSRRTKTLPKYTNFTDSDEDDDDDSYEDGNEEDRLSDIDGTNPAKENPFDKSIESLTERTNRLSIGSNDSNFSFEDSVDSNGSRGPVKDKAQSPRTRKAFLRDREQLSQTLFQEYDQILCDGRMRNDVSLEWSTKMRHTSGVTRMYTRSSGKRTAVIALSTKVVDSLYRLKCTLLHEMCHAAAHLFDQVIKPPHGEVFYKWANLAMSRIPGVKITTRHNYEISFKYQWTCQGCGLKYERHSRSVDPTKHRCGRCRGDLIQTKPKPRAANTSAYQQFLAEQTPHVRKRLMKESGGKVSQPEVMKECARLWKLQKEAS